MCVFIYLKLKDYNKFENPAFIREPGSGNSLESNDLMRIQYDSWSLCRSNYYTTGKSEMSKNK